MANRLTVYQGNKLTIRATITDENGTAVNLTGLTVSCTIYNGGTEVVQTDQTTHTTPASGITDFVYSQSVTALWDAPALLTYEIEVTYVDGSKFTAIRDYIELIKDLA